MSRSPYIQLIARAVPLSAAGNAYQFTNVPANFVVTSHGIYLPSTTLMAGAAYVLQLWSASGGTGVTAATSITPQGITTAQRIITAESNTAKTLFNTGSIYIFFVNISGPEAGGVTTNYVINGYAVS